MKNFAVLGTLFLSYGALAAVDLPKFMVGNWSQASRAPETDQMKISADLTFVHEITRQVGREKTSIPYPTVCRYRESGKVVSFEQADNERVKYYRDAKKDDPTYKLGFQIDKVELIESKANAANCDDFIKQQNDEATKDGLHYTWDFTDTSDNVLFDPWYSYIFTKN